MAPMHAVILLVLFCSAYCYRSRGRARNGPLVRNPEQEWERIQKVISDEMSEDLKPKFLRAASSASTTLAPRQVPVYLVVSSSDDHKSAFKPEKGAIPLPPSLRQMLLQTATTTIASRTTARPKLIEIVCHVDRMYVRVRKEIFKYTDAWKSLKLGTCSVNKSTKDHYYFLYLLTDSCGFKTENNADFRVISNVANYQPNTVVLREMPFTIPVQCKYPRFFHSYKVGFYPEVKGGTVLKELSPKSSFTLTPQDASGNDIAVTKYLLHIGQQMYFEAKQPEEAAARTGAMRMYINKCFMTASQDYTSTPTPKYTVIDNFGCMIDSKVSLQSKFITGTSKTSQKFGMTALIFKDKVSISSASQQIYMHCDISMGAVTPTAKSKACNYDKATTKWKELYGDDSLCTCCETTCSSASPKKTTRNMVSSHSWKVDLNKRDGKVNVHPRMKFLDADTFTLEHPSMAAHKASCSTGT
ncbi:zona pellucida sperm-binding protein 3-like isoform X2 [Trematomus bernacchii]|uniref:zona pellucida sperm-binding protein 3-like isoform X1 n=2 Tax=Trematomus bernacchii TaxID=40690 RepID=UPI00146D9182|nr:zona pellucida sperm-binding protein 3-like isoform X1 [Trematomus bernacchii]XP_033976479.1 zona pellucida sperm-binding protein 3-like isoform X2 [Trematomus bernacchii]